MKTTFRMVGMMLIAVLFSVGLASCGDDDDEPEDPATHDSSLVGTWVNVETASDGSWTETVEVTFSANGKYENKGVYEDSEEKETFKSGGRWSTSGNILTIECTYSDDADEVGEVTNAVYSINGKTCLINGEAFTKK